MELGSCRKQVSQQQVNSLVRCYEARLCPTSSLVALYFGIVGVQLFGSGQTAFATGTLGMVTGLFPFFWVCLHSKNGPSFRLTGVLHHMQKESLFPASSLAFQG